MASWDPKFEKADTNEKMKGYTITYLAESVDPDYNLEPTLSQVERRAPSVAQPCMFFNTLQGCRNGNVCCFVHQDQVPASPPRRKLLAQSAVLSRPVVPVALAMQAMTVTYCDGTPISQLVDYAINSQLSPSTPSCRFFNTLSGCKRGDACLFSHCPQ